MEDQTTFKKVINRDNFWLWCKVDGIQTHAQLELIPGPLWLGGLYLWQRRVAETRSQTCTPSMDLGSVVITGPARCRSCNWDAGLRDNW